VKHAAEWFVTAAAATCASCSKPSPPPVQTTDAKVATPWLEHVTGTPLDAFIWQSGFDGTAYLMPQITGGGGGFLDYDGDGDLDIYLVQGGDLPGQSPSPVQNRLLRNDGAWAFTDVTDDSGAGDQRYGMGLATGDVDGDGDVDLYITNVGRNTLLINNGDGTFTDRTEAAGVGHEGWGTSATFLDIDGDGDLDLYHCNYLIWDPSTEMECFNHTGGLDYCSPKNYQAPATDVLYRNLGDGTFENVSKAAGITLSPGTGLGVVAADFDSDGDTDLFVANDGMPDHFWRNDGAGHFTNDALLAGCAMDDEGAAKAGMGVSTGDIDDDGDFDLVVCNLGGESDSFFRNEGKTFVDATAVSGLRSPGRPNTRFGLGWVDLNNDSWLDLYQANGRVEVDESPQWPDPYAEVNLILQGSSSGRFRQVTPQGGTLLPLPGTSRAAAFGDLDDDGDIDILVVNREGPPQLLRNLATLPSVMITLTTAQGGPAIGATLFGQLGSRTITRRVGPGSSYLAANDPRIHVGLGDATALNNVTITWADGVVQDVGTLSAGTVYQFQQGSAAPLR
jgi:hypothetical protein